MLLWLLLSLLRLLGLQRELLDGQLLVLLVLLLRLLVLLLLGRLLVLLEKGLLRLLLRLPQLLLWLLDLGVLDRLTGSLRHSVGGRRLFGRTRKARRAKTRPRSVQQVRVRYVPCLQTHDEPGNNFITQQT